MKPTFQIVADSSADLHVVTDVGFAAAPLKIITADREYVDNPSLDIAAMVDDLSRYKGKSSSSCPNPDDWLTKFNDADYVFCIAISGTLSGSYNAAVVAKTIYEEAHPERRVHVINSLSTGPEMKLLIERLREGILGGNAFDEIVADIEQYRQNTSLIFVLESMKNLANNGRVNPLVAKAVGLLGIRIVGMASERGDLKPLDKCRGQERALDAVVRRMDENKYIGSKVRIAHCLNEAGAIALKERLVKRFGPIDVEIYPCGGLCSFYAEKGGLLIGFEHV